MFIEKYRWVVNLNHIELNNSMIINWWGWGQSADDKFK